MTRCCGGSIAIAAAAERLSSEQVEAALALLERCADKAKLRDQRRWQKRHRGSQDRRHLLLHRADGAILNPTDARTVISIVAPRVACCSQTG